MKQQEIEQLAEQISIDRDAIDHARILADAETAFAAKQRPGVHPVGVPLSAGFRHLIRAGRLAAALLVVSSLLACAVLYRRIVNLRAELELVREDVAPAQTDDTTTINLYLQEHQDVVARHASLGPGAARPAQMLVAQQDVLYNEFINDGLESMRRGIIVRGPAPRRETEASGTPVISNGHVQTLTEARRTAGFKLVAPSWLRPAYALDQIRRTDGHDALQLLYTDGIDSVSLFEQALDGQHGLSRQDFREYAVYCHSEQSAGTILAWRDDALAYVLIGNLEMSQLMDMAQSISAGR